MSKISYCKGRYEVLNVLGTGRWSSVNLCYDRDALVPADERVAVKAIHIASAEPGIAREMFRREVGALDGFHHPHVVRLRRFHDDTEHGQFLIVFDAVDGGRTLAHLLAGPATPYPLHWRLTQLLGVLDALDQAHRRGIVHRDIKPNNLLFDRRDNSLLLADFGIARVVEHYARGEHQATLRDFFTLPYAAPEQRLREDSNYPADLYAFGWIVSALLAWRVPTEDTTRESLVAPIQSTLAELADAALATEALAFLERLHAKSPDQRPNIGECRRLLERLVVAAATRPIVRVEFTTTARQKLAAAGFAPAWKGLADFNQDPRFRQEPDKKAEGVCVRCFGQRSSMLLKVKEGQLVVIDWSDASQPDLHAKSRERAVAGAFAFQEGSGPSAEFVQFVHDAALAQNVKDQTRKSRDKLVEIAKFILKKQRERLETIHMHVRRSGQSGGAPVKPAMEDWKAKLVQIGANDTRREVDVDDKEFVTFEVVKSWAGERDAEPDATAPQLPNWCWETLEDSPEKLDVCLDAQVLGRLHAASREPASITVRLQGKRRLPTDGVITFRDVKSDTAIKRQDQAIDAFIDEAAVSPRLGELLLDPSSNSQDAQAPVDAIQPILKPDHMVMETVRRALAARDFFLVQGPPGTGKTTFITEVIAQILSADLRAKILLTSQSNEAVDNAVAGLRKVQAALGKTWRIVRDVRAKDGDSIPRTGFPYDYAEWAKSTVARCDTAWREAEPNMVGANSASVDRVLKRWREMLPNKTDAKEDYAASVHVWAMTLLRVPTLKNWLGAEPQFDYVIVDEAARATTSELLVALVTGRRFILVGDHKQLPPFFDTATRKDLRADGHDEKEACRSLFELLFEQMPENNRAALRRQFRMQESIGRMVGEFFYADVGLQHGAKPEERTIVLNGFGGPKRVWWLDVRGKERRSAGSTSLSNQAEVDAIQQQLESWEAELAAIPDPKVRYTVGVIAGYRDQVPYLRDKIKPNHGRWKHLEIRVATVDAFQGKEDDIILWSMVRSGATNLDFVSDERRLNVALSRAKRLLVIVGDLETARQGHLLSAIAEHIGKDCVIESDGGK